MKTLSELVTEYRQIIDQPNTAIITAAMANRDINRSANELYTLMVERNPRYFLTSATVTTVAATAFLDLPTDCTKPNKLLDSDSIILPHRDLESFNYYLASGKPVAWDTVGRRFMFSPVPDSTYSYTAYYTAMPDDMSLSTDTPTFEPGYENIIALKAAINSQMIRDEDVRDKIQFEYSASLRAFLNVVGTSQTGASRRVINSDYDMWDV